ncbi:HEPN domain-containing protein [Chitinophaga eiseniae]|uniref:HEPN domain-containing protein n=1 Tax=Chitinophaga eiseniae TaxID=634771 RepID=A0A1T4MN08_9BACT|nr:HEPN domain-containing protein [Chitinophaga eiseniae]SJZ68185.1 HEPN domain-containing protein [Chitinophaga eiseniae]
MLDRSEKLPTWLNKPYKLTEPEIENPFLVLEDFFEHDYLYGNRDSLWELLKSTVTGSYPKDLNRKERSNIIYFYELLERLIEACYLIHSLWSEKKLFCSPPGEEKKDGVENIACEEEEKEFENNPIYESIIDSGRSIPGIDKIFMIKHHHRSDYAASLLYLTHNNTNPHTEVARSIQSYFLPEFPVNILIRPATEVCNALKTGHLFYERVCHTERIKYDAQHTALPKPEPTGVDHVKKTAVDKFDRIYAVVPGFLSGADYYRKCGNTKLAAFSLHQVAEHSLRALLISVMGFAPHTHRLNTFLKATLFLTEEIGGVFQEDDENDLRLLQILNLSYVKGRYNICNDYIVSEEDIKTLFDKVSDLECKIKGTFTNIILQHGKLSHSAYKTDIIND